MTVDEAMRFFVDKRAILKKLSALRLRGNSVVVIDTTSNSSKPPTTSSTSAPKVATAASEVA